MSRCRACKSPNLFLFLPLGKHPPANGFLRAGQLNLPEATFPLNAYVCLDCALIQVPDNVPADFFRHYVYVPSGATTMVTHFEAFADEMVRDFTSSPSDLIVDIGCNNGLFLGFCKQRGARVLGIDPAANLVEIAARAGIDIVGEYFGAGTAEAVVVRHPRAAVIVTTNTLNHIADLHDFMSGIDRLLGPEGVFVIEVPQALTLVAQNEFDTIYHEHVSEFSVHSVVALFEQFDLALFDIKPLPIHGGSMRLYAQRRSGPRPISPVVAEWLERERAAGLFSKETYVAFSRRVGEIRAELLRLLAGLRARGKTIAGYGAPAKGNTLLNYYGIGTDTLPYLVDRNELKHGLYSPGMHIPVVPPSRLLEDPPDYLLVLAWNFIDEIAEQQSEYLNRGGKLIAPIPEPSIIG